MNDKCRHEWQIWPETDGYEQRCRICAAFRRTPDDDRNAAIGRGSSAPKPEAQVAGELPADVQRIIDRDWFDYVDASHDAQQPPAFQRWSMTKGSDGARWSVYMDHDPCGEWVKWIEVQQHCFGIALAQQDGKASGWDVQRIAQWLYDDHCANQNSIHCNRFPSYAELSEGGRKKWMDKAHAIAALTKDQQP